MGWLIVVAVIVVVGLLLAYFVFHPFGFGDDAANDPPQPPRP